MLRIAKQKEKKVMTAVLSPVLGHIMIQLSADLSATLLPMSRGYECLGEVTKMDELPENSNPAPSYLDEAIQTMQRTSTNLWARYVEQLNAAKVANDHIDNSVLSRVLQEYLVGEIRALISSHLS